MVKFERYPHVNDLIEHYARELDSGHILEIVKNGITSENDAKRFSRFIWKMAEAINEDEENQISVLGRKDNTDMLPDISYEVSLLMKSNGYYGVWQSISREEME